MGCALLKEQNVKGRKKEDVLRARKVDASRLLRRNELEHLVPQVTLLLLGAGESGKSTFMKQLKNVFLNGFTKEEKEKYVSIIHSNALIAMHSILSFGLSSSRLQILPENQERIEIIMKNEIVFHKPKITKEIAKSIKELWEDPLIKNDLYQMSDQYQLIDSASYFFENIERIADENYSPNSEDILIARARSIDVQEICFEERGTNWRIIDVGGQRDERKKWIDCFPGVSAILFCVALSEYNLKLIEDEKVNRMEESLLLFEEIANFSWFGSDLPIILLLNKNDLFRKKIQFIDLFPFFPDYNGGCNYEKAIAFIKNKFTSLIKNSIKPTYIHVCCAIDENQTKEIFSSIANIILRSQNSSDLF